MQNTSAEVRQTENGMWRVLVPGLSPKHLRHILLPDASWVLLEDHDLDEAVRWRDVAIPVSLESSASVNRVRCVRMDLLYAREAFLRVVDTFETMGISLWQLTKEPPDSLRLSNFAARATLATLREVGLMLSCDLPHRGELTLIQTLDRKTLDEALVRLANAERGTRM